MSQGTETNSQKNGRCAPTWEPKSSEDHLITCVAIRAESPLPSHQASQAPSEFRGLTTPVLAPCSFPTLGGAGGLWSTVYLLCLSEAPFRGLGLSVGNSDPLTAWPALSWTKASPNADKEPRFPNWSPPDVEEKWGFLVCLGGGR